MEIEKQLEKVCFDLNIKFDKDDMQDWGIIHSDAIRVKEFIEYFTTQDLNDYVQYYLFDLIVASYNDAILLNNIDESLKISFLALVNKSSANNKLNIIKDYWRNLNDAEEFPVGELL